jgi:hypothetical protein
MGIGPLKSTFGNNCTGTVVGSMNDTDKALDYALRVSEYNLVH